HPGGRARRDRETRSNPGAQWRDPTPHRPPPSARTQSHTPTNRNLTPRAFPIKEAHMNTRLILWHIEISHYNEKARWALDLKGVGHERRALVPGYHMAVALALTRGRCYTTPILELDGRRIG